MGKIYEITLEPIGGARIGEVAEEAREIAVKNNCRVRFQCGDMCVTIEPETQRLRYGKPFEGKGARGREDKPLFKHSCHTEVDEPDDAQPGDF